MSNNVIFGKLNKKIIPLEYTGVDTETANTIVDNENKTIEVNVLGIDGVVKYNEEQHLTSEEKERAKNNIGVIDYVGGTTETAEVHISGDTISVDVTDVGEVYTAGDNIQISADNVISATDTTYSIATDSTAGLVKSSTTGSTPNKDYNVEVNVDGTMKVNVPWTDTTYSSLSPAQGGTDSSLVTTGEKYTWNNKQDALVSGTNIKTINNESVLGSGNISIVSYHNFNPSWTTNSTTEAFCDSIVNDSSAVAGMTYLGKLMCSDLPSGLVQGEAVVEIISNDVNGKAIDITLSSVTNSPYRWTYARAKVNGSYVNTGWKAYQLEITSSNKLSSDLVDDTNHTNKFVTASEKTTWNGKQNALTFDSTPTENSTNPVTSGGVYTALTGKQDTLVGSGTGQNIKTINSTSVLGEGNIDTKELYKCTYGTTTYAQITQALSDGKIPVCFYNDIEYVYVGLSRTNRYTFSSQLFDTNRYVSVNSSDSWGIGSNNLEIVSNKVTSISSGSTDTQYPSAKCVYDGLTSKQDVIDATHKLSADLVDDANTTNKFVTATDKTTWGNKQDALTAGANIQISNNEISVSLSPNAQTSGSEPELTSLTINGTKYRIASETAIFTDLLNRQYGTPVNNGG